MYWKIKQAVDLARGFPEVKVWPEALMLPGDSNAHTWIVEVLDNAKPVNLAGYKVTASFERSDGKTVYLEGSSEENIASVVFDPTCYAVQGALRGIMRIGYGDSVLTLCEIYFYVRKQMSSELIDPGEVVPDIDALMAQIAAAKDSATAANTAASAARTAAKTADIAAASANTSAQTAQNAAATANAAAESASESAAEALAAASKAEEAAANADTATGKVESVIAESKTATSAANSAANAANEAAASATQSAATAESAAKNADNAAENASESADNANIAAENANTAASGATTAANNADAATGAAQTATENAVLAASTANANAQAAQTAAQTANDAATKAYDAAEAAGSLAETVDEALAAKVDDAYVENNKLYLTAGGVVVAGPLEVGSGTGGGGSSNNAVMKLTNTSGFLSKTIASGGDCVLTATWSSLEDELSTGNGVMAVSVKGAIKVQKDVVQGDISVDVSEYLAAGINTVKLTVTDVYGNARTISYSITVVAVSLGSTFNAKVAYGDVIDFPYTPVGAVEKTMVFELDGTQIGTAVVSSSGREQTYSIPAQSHGAHKFRAWFTAEVDGVEVTSNILTYSIICVESGNNTPIVACAYDAEEASQYSTLKIPYIVYDPSALTASAELYVNGVLNDTLTVDRTQQIWNLRAVEAGELAVKVKCGDAEWNHSMLITAVEIDVSAETSGLELYLTSAGRSNQAANLDVWENNGIAAVFNGFNFVSDGWVMDDNGNTVLRVTGDARLEIPLKLFEKDFSSTGKTIEIEFATRSILNYDAVILSCMSGGRGLEITSQKANLTSEQSTIGTQYKEDEHVRLSFSIEKNSGNRFIYCYINGILSGVKQYPTGDDFSQVSPVTISIGSNECTIDLYCIRVYSGSLTRYQILDNWIADTQDGELMFERYERNQIYDDYDQIVVENLPQYLPYLVIVCPVLPSFKGDKKTCSGYYVDPLHPEKSFSFENATVDVQGTSSQYYYVKNWKIKFANGFILTDGTTIDVYQLNDNVIPTNTYTFKADVASSEGANNVVLAELYNELCPVKIPAQEDDPRVRQTIDGHPIVIFWDSGDGNPAFAGKYNFNHDKGTEEIFGFEEGDESWEIRQNGTDRVGFRSADFSEGSGWEDDFEARYPDGYTNPETLAAFSSWVVSTDPDQATKEAIESVTFDGVEYTTDTSEYRLAKFKAELPEHASVEALVFYYVFTEIFLCIDQREKNAFPTFYAAWLMLMLVLFYDADSSLGTDNKGNLAFDYFLEDIDYTDAGEPVYNGQNSVLWANLRKTHQAEIEAEYQRLRTTIRNDGSGLPLLSYDVANSYFEEHQSHWPEAIFNEDGFKKSIEPMILEGDETYLPMLQGKKEQHRKWWLYNRFRYLDSKYVTGTSMTNRILIRAHAKGTVMLVSYVNMYGHVYFNSEHVSKRMERGKEYLFESAASGAEDTVIGINDADLLTDIGDISALLAETIDISGGFHLTKLKAGDSADTYSNGNLVSLTLGNNTLIRHVDVRNCPSLTDSIDASGCTNVEELYFDGTSIVGISLPNGGALKVLHLPATVVNLTIQNQAEITDFYMPSYSQITTLRLENVSSAVDTAAILAAIAEGSRVRLIGLDWNMDDAEAVLALYDHLDTMRGMDEGGNTVETAQVSGVLHIDSLTGAQLAEMQSRYPYITIDYQHITSYCYFYSYDGKTLLYTAAVQDGADAVYGGSTPTRSSTAQYTYSFVGWSLNTNATSANSSALKNVTADRNVYAAFSQTVRTYTVYFYNGSTLLQTVTNVPYGGSATYTGDTPVDAENGLPFEGWSPSPSGITGNTGCYAQFTSPKEVAEITDDWATIIAAIDDGTYATKYKVGNYKALDLGSEGIVNMQIAAINKEALADGTGVAPISWISMELLTTSHRMNPSLETNYDYPEKTSWTASGNTWTSQNRYVVSDAVASWKITATDDQTLTISYKTSNSTASRNAIDITVNGETVATDYTSTTAATYDVVLSAGDVVEVSATYSLLSASYNYYGTVTFSSTGTFTTEATVADAPTRVLRDYTECTGAIGGWEKSEMRTYLQETIKPLIPEEIRNRLRTVSKTHPAYNTSGSSFTQTTADDVWIPSYNECFGSSSMYYNLFENTAANRIKYKVGSSSASWWWLRSANGTDHFYGVGTSGSYYNYGAYNSGAVALGFCL